MRIGKATGLLIAESVLNIMQQHAEIEEDKAKVTLDVLVLPYCEELTLYGYELVQFKKGVIQKIKITQTAYEFFAVYTDYSNSKLTEEQKEENAGHDARETFDLYTGHAEAAEYVLKQLIDFAK